MYETDADLEELQRLLDRSFARYPREVYDFDWDTAHPEAPYARIEAKTLLAFKRR